MKGGWFTAVPCSSFLPSPQQGSPLPPAGSPWSLPSPPGSSSPASPWTPSGCSFFFFPWSERGLGSYRLGNEEGERVGGPDYPTTCGPSA